MNPTEEKDEPQLAYDEQTLLDWLSGIEPMPTTAARDIERRLGLPRGWLDAVHPPARRRR
jgi:hypothetical protein